MRQQYADGGQRPQDNRHSAGAERLQIKEEMRQSRISSLIYNKPPSLASSRVITILRPPAAVSDATRLVSLIIMRGVLGPELVEERAKACLYTKQAANATARDILCASKQY